MKTSRRYLLTLGISFMIFTVLFQSSRLAGQNTATVTSSHDARGEGTTNFIPIWLTPHQLGTSDIFESTAGNVGIRTITPKATLDVNGVVNAARSFNLGNRLFGFGSFSDGSAFLGFSGSVSNQGCCNTGIGFEALSATIGGGNTASGFQALNVNNTGIDNTATGFFALKLNTMGSFNTATGVGALASVVSTAEDTAVGVDALFNSTDSDNTAVGGEALSGITTGTNNTALGYNAGNATDLSPTSGSNNTFVGASSGPGTQTTLNNATAIGANAIVGESNALVLGGTGQNAVRVGIGTATPANVFTIAQGAGSAIGDGWHTYSSQLFKTNVHTLTGALLKVEKLRGVSYDLKANGKHEIGVIAEEVSTVVPEVVARDKNGNADALDYGRLTPLLIEAIKEQQKLIREQQKQIGLQQLEIARITSQVRSMRAVLKARMYPHPLIFRAVKTELSVVRQ
jgi:hypothetical protein